jgi:putative ABC transport system permease protein
MVLLSLALKSLRNRLLVSALTVLSIALSVTLLVGVENVRAGVRDSFAGTIRGTDLIVGARGGTMQVLMSTVFGMATPAGGITMGTYEQWKAHPAIKWTIPYSLGDSHRGFRVIGTTSEFFEHYRFRNERVTFAEGGAPTGDTDVAIGHDVAQRLGYRMGQKIVVAHGTGGVTFSEHQAHPFTVVGIIARTFTPIDRALYVTLAGIEAMHELEESGGAAPAAPPAGATAPGGAPLVMPGASGPPAGATAPGGAPLVMPGSSGPPAQAAPPPPPPAPKKPAHGEEGHEHVDGDEHDHDDEHAHGDDEAEHDHDDDKITAFFVGTQTRLETLRLQREMNDDTREPLTAIVPGVALAELWQGVGNAEVGLKVVAFFTVLIGLAGMLVSLYSSLEARRREMAILRAVGARPSTIVALLVLESGVLAVLGAALGVALVYAGLSLAQGPVEDRFGLLIPIRALGSTEWMYLALIVIAGFLVGLVPAWKAYRSSLVDGLSPRT